MVALVAWLAVALAPAMSAQPASVRLSSLAPPTAAGAGFRAGERVAISLRVRARVFRVKTVAGTNGRFKVSFSPLIAVEPCTGRIVVAARGSSGSTANWSRECRPPDPQP